MSKKSRTKGYIGEWKARKLLTELGYDVRWTAEDITQADLRVNGEKWEVKYGLHVPKKIYQWMNEKHPDVLMVKRIGKGERGNDWLIIRRLRSKQQGERQ